MPNQNGTETTPHVSCYDCAMLIGVPWMPVEGPAKCEGCQVELV